MPKNLRKRPPSSGNALRFRMQNRSRQTCDLFAVTGLDYRPKLGKRSWRLSAVSQISNYHRPKHLFDSL
jgi:hypothetical protein